MSLSYDIVPRSDLLSVQSDLDLYFKGSVCGAWQSKGG